MVVHQYILIQETVFWRSMPNLNTYHIFNLYKHVISDQRDVDCLSYWCSFLRGAYRLLGNWRVDNTGYTIS